MSYEIACLRDRRSPSSSDLYRNLVRTRDSVVYEHRPVIVVRARHRAPVVPIPLGNYAHFGKTRFLSSTDANARELRESIAELKAGRMRERDVVE